MHSFSIITIVFNDKNHIIQTMDSVLGQTYQNIEYILIDGGSTDGTKEVILDYLHARAEITKSEQDSNRIYLEATLRDCPTFSFKFLSEKDKGIYDAMNKGLALASKEWVNFMNCGDRFCNLEVLKKIASENIAQYDVIWGDVLVAFDRHTIHYTSKDDFSTLYQLFTHFHHQAFFLKTVLHKSLPYDTQYRLAGDYDLICKIHHLGARFCHFKIPIAVFFTGGASDANGFQSLKEAYKIALFYYPRHRIKIWFFYLFGKLKKIIKIYTPKSILKYPLSCIQTLQNGCQ